MRLMRLILRVFAILFIILFIGLVFIWSFDIQFTLVFSGFDINTSFSADELYLLADSDDDNIPDLIHSGDEDDLVSDQENDWDSETDPDESEWWDSDEDYMY